MTVRISRRSLIGSSLLLTVVGPLAAACAQAPAPAATSAPAKAAEAPKPADAAKPAAEPTKPAAAAAATSTPAPAAAPAAGGKAPVTVRVHTFAGGNFGELITDAYQSDAGGWKSKNPNVAIKVDGVNGWLDEYIPKVFAWASANQLGDIVWQVPTFKSHAAWATKFKLVRSLDELAKAANYDAKSQFFPASVDSGTIEGKLYYLNYVGEPAVPAMIWNKTKIEKAGLQIPSAEFTYDELAEWARKATTKDTFAYSRAHHGGSPIGESTFLRQWGVELADPGGKKVILAENRDRFVGALKWRHSLFHEWKVSPLPDAANDDIDLFAAEKVLAVAVWPYWLANTGPLKVKGKFEIAATPLPLVKKGDKRRSRFNDHVMGVTTASKTPDEAFAALTFISSKDVQLHGLAKNNWAPVARPDFWNDPKVPEKVPNFAFLKEMMQSVESSWVIANFRGMEVDSAYKNVYAQLELDKIKPEQAADEIQKACQAIADKEPA